MSEQDLISVIVPVYNAEKYLDRGLASLAAQTHKNIEVLLINDGSFDGSASICNRWGKCDARFKVIHGSNYGVSHARNIGLENASGDYIGFMDADDWVEPDMYEQMLRSIKRDHTEACGAGYIHQYESTTKNALKIGEQAIFSQDEILQQIFSIKKKKILQWEVCDKLFRRELFEGIRFDEEISMAEDMLVTWQVLKRVKRFSYTPLYKYHYVMQPNSACHRFNIRHVLDGASAVKKIYEDNKSLRYSEDTTRIMEQLYLKSRVSKLYKLAMLDLQTDCLVHEIDSDLEHVRKNWSIVLKNQDRTINYAEVLASLFLYLPYGAICTIMLPMRWLLRNNIW